MNILIVDDEAGALRDLSREMKKAAPDDEIYTARESKTALTLCRERPFDVVFLDIRMPDMDGLTLAAEMKRIRPLVNIVMVTAYPNYALDALKLYVSDYILKPAGREDIKKALLNLRNPVSQRRKGLYVQCFGNFEVYYDGVPVRFNRSKTKELFAYLVDRRGASVTNTQLRNILWMDESGDDKKQRTYFAQLVHELQNWLEEAGLSEILLHSRDSYAVVPDQIPCDYYLALAHDTLSLAAYQGEYMCQYEWAAYRNLIKDADNRKVTYASSNEKVAKVDASGKITAVANGTAKITVKTVDGGKTATVQVTVQIPAQQATTQKPAAQKPTTEQPTTAAPATEAPAQQAAISINAGLKISQTGSRIKVKWGKVKDADGYKVYAAYCGKKFGKPVMTIKGSDQVTATITKLDGKKINLKKNFKVYVTAYGMKDGKETELAKTITGHVVGRLNSKYSNVKKIRLKKSSVTVAAGKTVKLSAKTVLVDPGKKQLTDAHAKEFRYASTDESVATVDAKGKIKGVGAGTCTVYVYARNGYAKKVSVTVK